MTGSDELHEKFKSLRKILERREYNWKDIGHEAYRSYRFPNCEENVVIRSPKLLDTSGTGHRIVDKGGKCHYIPQGWIQLTWEGGGDFRGGNAYLY